MRARLGLAGVRMVLAAAALLAVAAVPARANGPPADNPGELCARETRKAERLYDIPPQLLNAISIVESGRYDRDSKATTAWPWTVTSGGEGKYFPSKAEAVAEVRRLKGKGVKNIDVGCMQVNLLYHPDAFPSIEEAFEPARNVGYAARFLKGLYGATSHWPTAASYYHSQTPSLAAAYRERLMKVWNGPGAGTAMASVRPVPPAAHALKPVPPSSGRVDQLRQEWKDQAAASREEARRIADAYRQARLAEYKLRRVRMVEGRRAAGLSPDGY